MHASNANKTQIKSSTSESHGGERSFESRITKFQTRKGEKGGGGTIGSEMLQSVSNSAR